MPDIEYSYQNMIFRWDEHKAKANIKKHGISFEEAASAFDDVNAKLREDDEHSDNEERFVLLGYNIISQLLVVCH